MSDTTSSPGLLAIFDKNPKRKQRIQFLASLFKTDGFELRIAGGAVRDILRGKEPTDIDFATNALPDQSLAIFKRHEDLLRIIVTTAGQRHGTVAVKFKEGDIDQKRIKLADGQDKACKPLSDPEYDDESPYEVTTLRCDVEADGRHAEVKFINDWKLDAERRDLTINSMFLTLDEGKLIDYYDGASDLEKGLVRFVGNADKRIKEDYLRILRYFRFWSRYGRGIPPDKETRDVISARLDGLDQISGERLWSEVKKIFCYPPCHDVIKLMMELNLFSSLGLNDPHVSDKEDWIQKSLNKVSKVETNIQDYKNKLADCSNDSVAKRMSDLLPVILFASCVQTETMCLNAHKRMKFSNIERDSIIFIVENQHKQFNLKGLKALLALTHCPARPHTLNKIRALLIYKGQIDLLGQIELWTVPEFPISGVTVSREVKKRGLPGDRIKDLLQELKQCWVDGDYKASSADLEALLESKLNQSTSQ